MNGNKGQKCFNKNVERFCWEKNKTKLTCFNFVVEKGKITLVTLVRLEKTLKVTLKWLQGCQETNKK